MKKIILISPLLFSLSMANDWVVVGAGKDTIVLVAPSTRVYYPDQKLAKIWSKYMNKEADVIKGKIYNYYVAQNNYNCVERTGYTKEMIYYKNDGTVSYSASNLPYAKYKEYLIVPQTLGESVFEAACFGKEIEEEI